MQNKLHSSHERFTYLLILIFFVSYSNIWAIHLFVFRKHVYLLWIKKENTQEVQLKNIEKEIASKSWSPSRSLPWPYVRPVLPPRRLFPTDSLGMYTNKRWEVQTLVIAQKYIASIWELQNIPMKFLYMFFIQALNKYFQQNNSSPI